MDTAQGHNDSVNWGERDLNPECFFFLGFADPSHIGLGVHTITMLRLCAWIVLIWEVTFELRPVHPNLYLTLSAFLTHSG